MKWLNNSRDSLFRKWCQAFWWGDVLFDKALFICARSGGKSKYLEWWRIDGTMLDGSHGPWNTIHLLFFLLWTLGGFSYSRKNCKWCKISSLINHFIENGHSQKKKAKVGRNRAKFAKVWWPWERLREFFVINADTCISSYDVF